jgi:NADH-quinone oxidoreductase subunit G
MRILPAINDDINEEWLGDKSRNSYDGLLRQRLDRPYVRNKKGKLEAASWGDALKAVAAKLTKSGGTKIAAIAGDLADAEAMVALKDLFGRLGSPNLDCRQDGAKIGGPRVSYIFNSGIAGIEEADALLLIGTNPRLEAPVLNARIRKRWLKGGFKVGVVGPAADYTYKHDYFGDEPKTLEAIAAGSHDFAKILKDAKRPMLIIGQGAVARPDGDVILGLARKIAEQTGVVSEGWNGFNMLHQAASRVGGLDLGFVPGVGGRDVAGILDGVEKGEIEVVYLLGADEIDMNRLGKAFVIYQGHHGDAGAHRADVVLPGAAYTEKDATYVNTEGRVQVTRLAVFPPGEAKEDWKILRALAEVCGQAPGYDTLEQVRARLAEVNAVFGRYEELVPAAWEAFGAEGDVAGDAKLGTNIANYYMTDPISRASTTMAECTAAFVTISAERTGTHG